MKKTILILLGQLLAVVIFAQTVAVQGQVIDAQDNSPLPRAHILLTDKEGRWTQTAITDGNGFFNLENVQLGQYNLTVSFIGFEEYNKEILVKDMEINLGLIPLREGIDLQIVQVTEQVLPVLQKGDTTQFNAAAYKTLPDVNAEDLLEKMPTIVIEEGKVQAQGEDVKRVLVDGKPFFGEDPTAALRNLPAEVIDKIQVFDQQSEQAQFTGFNDGETSKTINIITKASMRNGQFGKIYAGYGYEDKNQAGGNINIFNGDQRISIIGMSNNINQQNFAAEDLLGVVGSSGKNRSRAGGGGNRSGGAKEGIVLGFLPMTFWSLNKMALPKQPLLGSIFLINGEKK